MKGKKVGSCFIMFFVIALVISVAPSRVDPGEMSGVDNSTRSTLILDEQNVTSLQGEGTEENPYTLVGISADVMIRGLLSWWEIDSLHESFIHVNITGIDGSVMVEGCRAKIIISRCTLYSVQVRWSSLISVVNNNVHDDYPFFAAINLLESDHCIVFDNTVNVVNGICIRLADSSRNTVVANDINTPVLLERCCYQNVVNDNG